MGYLWFETALDRLSGIGITAGEVTQALAARKLPVPATLPTGLPVVVLLARTRLGRVLAVLIRPGWPHSMILAVREPSDTEVAWLEEFEQEGEEDHGN